ncbi:methyltransferase domain-containing protein, partial [bacterium]|nr:methyltransferase domain-containing protein [bacterium]
TIEKQTEKEVVQGALECLACNTRFEIKSGFPNLIFPEALEDTDLRQERWHDQHAQRFDQMNRHWSRDLFIWSFWLWETRARRQLVDKLELKKNASVLETGVGTGSDIPIIAKQIGRQGQLHGMDISYGIIKHSWQKMKAKGIYVHLIQGNASYLPYRTMKFDAVLHVGALNHFGDKKRAVEEMHRVAKPGSKIVICDEGLAPGKEKTWLGKRILKRAPALFDNKPPVELVPNGIEDLEVYWVWQKTFWVIEFRKKL